MTKERILIVEDEPHVAKDIQVKLEQVGYTVIGIASSAQQALQEVARGKPDLVLMDIILEGDRDGIAAAMDIQRDFSIPVIYLTAHAEDELLQRAKLSGPFGYILKPVNSRELHAVITLALYQAEVTQHMQRVVWTNATLMGICDAVITLDTQGVVVEINPAAADLLRTAQATAHGRPLHSLAKLVDRCDGATLMDIVTSVAATDEPYSCERDAMLEVAGGVRVPVHFSLSPIRDQALRLIGMVLVVHNDTARQKVEGELIASERKFRTLAETTDSPIIVYRDKILYVNRAGIQLSGYSEAEMLGMSLLDLVHPDYRAVIAAGLRERLAGNATPQYYLIKFITKGGAERWLEISAAVLDYEGAPAGIATGYDITEHIAGEAALRANERQLAAITENTGAVIYIKNMEGRFLLVNHQFEKILGLPKAAMLGKTTHELFPKEVADQMRANDLAAAEAPGPVTYEERVVQIDGEHDYVSVKVPLRDEAGKVYAICGISTDISAQKRLERGMAKLGPLVQRLLATATDEAAFYRVVCDGIIDLVQADIAAMPLLDEGGATFTYRAAAGRHADLLLGKSMSLQGGGLCGWVAQHGEALSVPDLSCDTRMLPELVQALEVSSALVTPLVRDEIVVGGLAAFRSGKPFDAIEQQLLTLYSHRVTLALGNLRLLQSLEQRVAERTAQLANSNAELEAFSYSVSHDLRAPLRSIEGFSQALFEDYGAQLDEQGRDFLQRVRNGAARMSELIDDLLALSRVSRSDMRRAPVDLSALAISVAQGLQARMPEQRVAIDIAPGLTTEGDAHLLQIALENLFGNAWKFTRKQAQPSLEFGVSAHNGTPAFFVRDNGAGFDMAHAGKLFGAFERLHADTDFEGTGIGLATVRRVIERHGGKVWAESKPGQGATFYFTL